MFRKILLILFISGLTVLSVLLEYRASADMSECQPPRVCLPEAPRLCETLRCLPEVTPPACEMPVCEAAPHPLHRQSQKCLRLWHEVSKTVSARPHFLCFLFPEDKLNTVARVSTADSLRALSR